MARWHSTWAPTALAALLATGCPGNATKQEPEKAAAATVEKKPEGLRIGLLLPESKTTRYESFDRPLFEAKVKALCADCEVALLQRRPGRRQAAVAGRGGPDPGREVLVLDAVDAAAVAPLVNRAKAAEGPGHRLRPAHHRHRLRRLRLVRQRQGRRDAGRGAPRCARGQGHRRQGQDRDDQRRPHRPELRRLQEGRAQRARRQGHHRQGVRHARLEPGQGAAGDGAGHHGAGQEQHRGRAMRPTTAPPAAPSRP